MRMPGRWTCRTHGAPVHYGCIHCDRIARRILDELRKPPSASLTHAQRVVGSELLLRYRADDVAYSVSRREIKRATVALFAEAKRYAREVSR